MKPPMTAIARRASLAFAGETVRFEPWAQATQDRHLQGGEYLVGEGGFGATGGVAQTQHLPRDYCGKGQEVLKGVDGLKLSLLR